MLVACGHVDRIFSKVPNWKGPTEYKEEKAVVQPKRVHSVRLSDRWNWFGEKCSNITTTEFQQYVDVGMCPKGKFCMVTKIIFILYNVGKRTNKNWDKLLAKGHLNAIAADRVPKKLLFTQFTIVKWTNNTCAFFAVSIIEWKWIRAFPLSWKQINLWMSLLKSHHGRGTHFDLEKRKNERAKIRANRLDSFQYFWFGFIANHYSFIYCQWDEFSLSVPYLLGIGNWYDITLISM